MQWLAKYFLERPMLVNVMMIVGLIYGFQTILSIQKEGIPLLTLDEIVINTVYPGASGRDVELGVTSLIEEELQGVANIKEITSQSTAAISAVRVIAVADLSESQFNDLYSDIVNAVNAISDFPTEAWSPVFKRISSAEMSILEVALSGNQQEIRQLAPYLERQLQKVSGVSSVTTVGLPDDEYHILVDPDLANKYFVDLSQVYSAIQQRNVEGSGGAMSVGDEDQRVVSYNKFSSVQDLLDTNIRRNYDGKGIKLSDIAAVELAPQATLLDVRNNGDRGISLVIKKTASADIIKTVDAVKKTVAAIEVPGGVKVDFFNDQSEFTRNRLSLLSSNAITGFILVFLLLVVVLNLKTAFWTSFSIPFSLMIAVIMLPFLGLTINAITLGGVVLVLGMVVDDAIIIAEQFNTEKEKGASNVEAGFRAVKKIWRPIFASSTTTVLAYLPLAQLGGLPGEFIWAIPAVVALTLAASLFDTYFLLPSHLAQGRWRAAGKKKFVQSVENFYERSLHWVYQARYLVLLCFVVLFGASIYIALNVMTIKVFPQESVDTLHAVIKQKPGITKERAEQNIIRFEQVIAELPAEELQGMSSRIGTNSTVSAELKGVEPNLGVIFIFLTDFIDRDRDAEVISRDLASRLKPLAEELGAEVVIEPQRQGPPVGFAFEANISSKNDQLREQFVGEMKEALRSIEGVHSVQDDQMRGMSELNLLIDNDAVTELGVTVDSVVQNIKLAYDGLIASTVVENNENLDLRVRFNQKGRSDIKYIEEIGLRNTQGNVVKLGDLVTMEKLESLVEITRLNGLRTTQIYAQVHEDKTSPGKVLAQMQEKFRSNPEVEISYTGESIESDKIFGDLGIAGVVALTSIFLTLMLVLNSTTLPFVIMMAIPFSLIGVIWSTWLHGMDLSMFVMISVVGLSGIIVNDSILMVATIRELGDMPKLKDIIEAAVSRLRPVLMTTITTVLGLLPTAYAFGGYDPFISPMCLSLSYGLMFGTLVILVLVPILYFVNQDLRRIFSRQQAE